MGQRISRITRIDRNILLIYAAALMRALGIGMMGVILGIYLSRADFTATQIGLVVASGLAGVALATVVISFYADRLGRRRTLTGLALLAGAGGLGLAFTADFSVLLPLAFVGLLNGMGRDRGPAYALEQATVPATLSDERRTWALAWYNVVLDTGHALGALAGALPFLFRTVFEVDLLTSYRLAFGIYAGFNLLAAFFYLLLSRQIEIGVAEMPLAARPPKISPGSRRIITKLAALFGMDSLGGGFLTGTLITFWFFQRFGVGEETLAPLFFAVRILNALSYLVAAWLARRIGLINTMVFTHIPSSALLIGVPLAPSLGWAVALFILRESLVEMDVPTRQSYLLAVVQPNERTFASGVTTVTRNAAYATAPSIAGYLMQHLALSTPLFMGGGIKIVYDLLLYFSFRNVKPPEES